MKKLFVTIIVILMLFVFWWSLGKLFQTLNNPIQGRKIQQYSGPVEEVIVGKQVEYGTLFVVAKEQKFFEENGLDVAIIEYESGAPAFSDMLNGKIDMTNAAEFVGVRNSFSGEDFKMLGSIGTTTNAWEIVVRSDHGISNASDLRGKKIAVPRKTLGEFFLGNFLTLNKLSFSDLQLVDLTPAALIDAFINGDVDAVMIFEPHAFGLKERMGSNAIGWPGQSGRPNYIGLFANSEFVKKHPSIVKRFVRSLVQAEEFLADDNTEIERVMKNTFHYSDSYISSVTPKFKFYFSLEQPMLLLMEDEARWVIDNNLTSSSTVPNYLDFIYFDALEEVNPDAINIIR